MPSSEPSFSIIVPTFRRADALRATLTALFALDYPPSRYEVIVIDDGAEPVTEEVLQPFRTGGVSLTLESQRQRGAACARNRGARLARGDMLLFCDDDILVDAPHLRQHLATRERHGDCVVNGAWEFEPALLDRLRRTPFGRYRIDLERQFQHQAAGAPMDGDPSCLRMPVLTSADLSIRRGFFWEIGGFDEDFPVAGAEDQDFSIRARETGALLLLDTSIRCLHNDNRISRRDYCAREERSAQTMPFLARKYPREVGDLPYVTENEPIRPGEPLTLILKKLLKVGLATRPALEALHSIAALLERLQAPDPVLRRLYSALLGLHLFKGFRRAWSG